MTYHLFLFEKNYIDNRLLERDILEGKYFLKSLEKSR
jgi:hypothetical protein